jgi:hypothetical protein
VIWEFGLIVLKISVCNSKFLSCQKRKERSFSGVLAKNEVNELIPAEAYGFYSL